MRRENYPTLDWVRIEADETHLLEVLMQARTAGDTGLIQLLADIRREHVALCRYNLVLVLHMDERGQKNRRLIGTGFPLQEGRRLAEELYAKDAWNQTLSEAWGKNFYLLDRQPFLASRDLDSTPKLDLDGLVSRMDANIEAGSVS